MRGKAVIHSRVDLLYKGPRGPERTRHATR
jgi:hypothetical protein